MKALFVLACLIAGSSALSAFIGADPVPVEDHCSKLTTCKDCTAEIYCGWCSAPVIYQNGSSGYRCAGFNPKSQDQPFKCYGKYQTGTCDSWACNPDLKQCVEDPSGQGSPRAECDPTCKKEKKLFACNQTTHTCVETEGGSSEEVCNITCSAQAYKCNEETFTCELSPGGIPIDVCNATCKVKPIPPALQGVWRGIQINSGYAKGEWEMSISGSTFVIKMPSGESSHGTVSAIGTTGLLFNIDGQGAVKAMYKLTDGPETKMMTLAAGKAGGEMPSDFSKAMTDGSTEFAYVACKDASTVCKFAAPSLFDFEFDEFEEILRLGDQNVTDHCMTYADCSSCVSEKYCGWCSDKVIYTDGSQGRQCAGFNPDQSKRPFTCSGIYSTEQCIAGYKCDYGTMSCKLAAPGEGDPLATCQQTCKVADTYECNNTTKTCEKATPGHGSSKEVCEQSCSRTPTPSPTPTPTPTPTPSNHSTPAGLVGSWRGVEISAGYAVGEFDAVFTNSTFTFTFATGEQLSGDVLSGDLPGSIGFQVTQGDAKYAGKTLYGLYQLSTGVETKFFTVGLSEPGAKSAPASLDEAMAGGGEMALVMASCLNASDCKFA